MPMALGVDVDDGLYYPQTNTYWYPEDSTVGSTGNDETSSSGGGSTLLEYQSAQVEKAAAAPRKAGPAVEPYDPEGFIATVLSGAGL